MHFHTKKDLNEKSYLLQINLILYPLTHIHKHALKLTVDYFNVAVPSYYVRNTTLHRDLRMESLEDYIRNLATNMFN